MGFRAEYNLAWAFRKTFGSRGAIITALADNEVGRRLEDIIACSGLDLWFVRWHRSVPHWRHHGGPL
ncbi:MAG: hypothetical protein LBJ62_06465 [Bifidobacteriaceae bacterium]|nr:hypothetical protein [Bifidobacteriaceae bacterium]